jgi:hypothetical protein
MVPTQRVAMCFNCRSMTTKLQQGGGWTQPLLPTMEWGRIVHSLPQCSFVLSYSFLVHINGFILFCIKLTLIILNMGNINNYDIMPPTNPPYQHLERTLVDNAYYWKPRMEVNVNILTHICIAFHLWMVFILVFLLSCIHLFHSNC